MGWNVLEEMGMNVKGWEKNVSVNVEEIVGRCKGLLSCEPKFFMWFKFKKSKRGVGSEILIWSTWRRVWTSKACIFVRCKVLIMGEGG